MFIDRYYRDHRLSDVLYICIAMESTISNANTHTDKQYEVAIFKVRRLGQYVLR